jgi:hypothetical protein
MSEADQPVDLPLQRAEGAAQPPHDGGEFTLHLRARPLALAVVSLPPTFPTVVEENAESKALVMTANLSSAIAGKFSDCRDASDLSRNASYPLGSYGCLLSLGDESSQSITIGRNRRP